MHACGWSCLWFTWHPRSHNVPCLWCHSHEKLYQTLSHLTIREAGWGPGKEASIKPAKLIIFSPNLSNCNCYEARPIALSHHWGITHHYRAYTMYVFTMLHEPTPSFKKQVEILHVLLTQQSYKEWTLCNVVWFTNYGGNNSAVSYCLTCDSCGSNVDGSFIPMLFQ